MTRLKQTSFFNSTSDFAPRVSHGGELRTGRRKLARPLDRQKPLHIVMKSSHAKGAWSLLGSTHRLKVSAIVTTAARRFKIKIHHFENVGSHLHFVVSFARREQMQNFLRSVPALIARAVTRARRGHSIKKRFWDHLVFTRVVSGRRDFQQLTRYMAKNEIEREFGGKYRMLIEAADTVARTARRAGKTVRQIYEEKLRALAREPDGVIVRARG